MKIKKLLTKAKKVLKQNWAGDYTIPARGLYPHQWNWDSGFTAIGLSHYDQEKAQMELLHLFEAQWANGFLPHIIFNPGVKTYFPDASYWDCSSLCDHTPGGLLTSGLTQPPIHALASWTIHRNAEDKNRSLSFLGEMFPRLMHLHRYLFEKRDPENCGVVSIYHPWESGQDNSPCWDEPLRRVAPANLPPYKRVDVDKVGSSEERPSDEDYDRYIYLVEILKSVNYDDTSAYPEMPFLVKDLCTNTVLYLSNLSLIEIAGALNRETDEIEGWLERMRRGFLQYLWDEEDGLFYSYDMRAGKPIRKRTVSSLLPLSTGILAREDSERLVAWLNHANFCGDCNCKYPVVPSSGVEEPDFKAITYWRGPVWMNMNWFILRGLREYGLPQKCEEIRRALLELIEESGFREYYDPLTGIGHGGEDFSWTASLIIDLIMSDDVN